VTGNGRQRIWLNSEKIAAFAPMPNASDRMATAVTNGARMRVRMAKVRSRMALI
jgi:hypothetical protein